MEERGRRRNTSLFNNITLSTRQRYPSLVRSVLFLLPPEPPLRSLFSRRLFLSVLVLAVLTDTELAMLTSPPVLVEAVGRHGGTVAAGGLGGRGHTGVKEVGEEHPSLVETKVPL